LVRSTRKARIACLATVALLLTGCSTDGGTPGEQTSNGTPPTTPPTTASTSPSLSRGPVDAADAVSGKSGTYSVLPPDGWGEATDEVGAIPGVDLVLMSSEKLSGFNTNLVVHVATGDPALLDTELAKGRDDLAEQGRTVSDVPAITVAGAPATGFTTSFSQQGVEVVARSYGLHRDGRIYLLTLSSAKSAASQAAAELAEIIESWTWT
jgi:hypothetical protein